MTHEEVLAAVTDRNEVMVGEFNKKPGHMVVYCYSRRGRASMKAPKYYLYFLNDTLYRKSDPDDDLEEGAKLAMRERAKFLNDKEDREEQEALTQAAKEKRERTRQAEMDRRTAEAEARKAEREVKAETARQKREEQKAQQRERDKNEPRRRKRSKQKEG